jgi:hypothetical protein
MQQHFASTRFPSIPVPKTLACFLLAFLMAFETATPALALSRPLMDRPIDSIQQRYLRLQSEQSDPRPALPRPAGGFQALDGVLNVAAIELALILTVNLALVMAAIRQRRIYRNRR